MRPSGPAVTSCPTCGRTNVDLLPVAAAVEEALEALYAERLAAGGAKAVERFPRVAVMGCVVNGPGEAKDADVALCGADGFFMLYVKGEQVCRVAEADAARKVVEYVVSL